MALHRQVKLIEGFLRENPDDPRAAILGAVALATVALATVGDNEGSMHYLETVIAADPGDTTILYNAACTYAMMGRAPEALDALEKAVGNGWGDRSWIKHDPDLESLRAGPRYLELMQAI